MGFPNLGALYLIALSARPSSKEGCPGTLVVLSPLRRMSIRMVELADALLGGVFYGQLKQTSICCSFRGVLRVHRRWDSRFPRSQPRADWATSGGARKLQQIAVCFSPRRFFHCDSTIFASPLGFTLAQRCPSFFECRAGRALAFCVPSSACIERFCISKREAPGEMDGICVKTVSCCLDALLRWAYYLPSYFG